MIGKYKKIWSMSLLVVLAWACSNEKEVSGEKVWDTSLTFKMTRAPEAVINNTQVYLFDGEGAAVNQFRQKIPNITYAPDGLKMPAAAGIWNIALVSAEEDINGKIISPIRGQDRDALKMWETAPVSGALPAVPELRTAYLNGQHILAEQENVSSEIALLSRNVALVKVVIADARGLDENGTHKFQLTQVPTTLNWNGGLYPDKNRPTVSAEPMIGSFQVRNNPNQAGNQLSDTLYFMIPAHKGTDYLNEQPIDTTTHNLRLSVDLACFDGIRLEKEDVIIPQVPRANGILLVRLFLTGNLDMTTEILDWVDTEINADLSQTQLFTDKTSINLSFKDIIHVNTNAETYTVSKAPDADWISVQQDGNAVEITADIDTYVDNNPRTSYITIKANNVTKKIPVTQRPDNKGTIKFDVDKLVLCPNVHETGTINITSIGGEWKFLDATPKASASVQNGEVGTTPVTLTRSSTTDVSKFDEYYGDGLLVVKNIKTLDTDTLSLLNCFIYTDENIINASAPTGNDQSSVTNSQDISVYGGSCNIEFTEWSSWIHSDITWNADSQTLTMTTDREENDEAREGYLTFYHAECPDYSVTAKVFQDINVTIPAFNYFVLGFIWNSGDVDVAVEFVGNNLSGDGTNNSTYDKQPVGYGMSAGTTLLYHEEELLKWGGDATGGQGETVFFNAPVLNGDSDSPRKIKLDVYATWYTAGSAPAPITLKMTAYKDGEMTQVGTNFVNTGGEILYDEGYTVQLTTTKGSATYSTGGYTKVATITYDRVKNSASIHLWAGVATRSTRAAESVNIPFRPEVKPTIVDTYSDDNKGERK